MRRFFAPAGAFLIGGSAYGLGELLFRGHTHWTMPLLGGLCVLAIYPVSRSGWRYVRRCLAGAVIITALEFLCGCIVNLKYGLGVWDYSAHAGNLYGQICPLFSLLWFLLSAPADWLCRRLGGGNAERR